MRVESFGVNSIVHVTKRGTRGMPIVRDEADRWRFVKSLFYLNDSFPDPYWHREVAKLSLFARPEHWPEPEPLVRILAWTLLSNHFHLLLQEIQEGGIARFMQGLCGSMTKYFNIKYNEKGSIFQSSYHGRTINEDAHLNYLAFYILVKNVLEMYPKGLLAALAHFDDAWDWAGNYQFSSLHGHLSGMHTPIIHITDNPLIEIIGQGKSFKQEAKNLLEMHIASRGKEFENIMLEPW